MAKINLLTIHWGMCYGAVMQTYGTCKLLEEAGHDVRVINIIHPKVKYKYRNPKKWIRLVREFQFWVFKKKYFSPLTKKVYSISESPLPKADITIVGSDQVWNKTITGAFENTYYLDFVPSNQKRIALSSSFGISAWNEPDEYTRKISELFDRFDAISIREKSGVQIMKDIFNKEAVHLLDPSLGYGKFDGFVKRKKEINSIFTFLLNPSQETKTCINKMAFDIGTPLYSPNVFEKIFKTGPCDWLENIYNSKYVITDSFHGTALSILYHKPFFVFCANEKKFTRIESLLSLLGLTDRYIKSYDDFIARKNSLLMPIDYIKVDKILDEERTKYQNFIRSSIVI